MRTMRIGCWAALVFAGAAAPTWAEATKKSLTPQHESQLRQEINQCAQRVKSAPSLEARCQEQEELCKKLLQAEDYDYALQAASAVYSTQGINPERRAAHHFLMAQIYAMKMEASASPNDMEKNRQQALTVAQQVVSQKYPEQWRVGDAATRLIQELQDPRKLMATRSKLMKRQAGGATPGLEAVARQQAAQMGNSVSQQKQSLLARSVGTLWGRGKSSSTTMVADEPAKQALAQKLAKSGRTRGIIFSDATKEVGSKLPQVSYSSTGARISDSRSSRNGDVVRGSGRLKGGVIIDGTTIYHVTAGSTAAAVSDSKVTRN